MTPTPDATATPGNGALDAREAAALLDQATEHARSAFMPGTPALFVFRAAAAVAIGGGFWLSVRSQDPYTGPRGAVLPVVFALVAINIGWSAWLVRRAGAGITGPAHRNQQVGIGLMLAAWVVAYVVTAHLYRAGVSYPVWGLYPASAPLLIVGLAGAVITAALLRDWPGVGTCLVIAILGAAAGFGGPAGAWLITGIGLCAVCLGYAALTGWRQHRSVIRP
jgi:hypothetical protein